MAKKLIDIDIELLGRAKEIIGAETYKDTVNAGPRAQPIGTRALQRARITRRARGLPGAPGPPPRPA